MALTEYDVASYVTQHKEGLVRIFNSLDSEVPKDLWPFYEEAKLEEVRHYLADKLNVSYADVAEHVDKEFVIKWLTL